MLRRVLKPVRAQTARSFAAAAKKPPLRLYGPSAIYSNALFETCEEDKLDHKTVSKNLKDWAQRLEADPELRLFAEDSTVGESLRKQTVEEICKETGYDELTSDMIHSMMEHNATKHLGNIIKGFDELVSYNYNTVRAVVTSAEALTAAQISTIEGKVRSLAKGADITIETEVDPSLIGGLTIEMGSKFQDLSVRTAINACERAMRTAA
jgi:ATP synthase F1 delta subunit